MYKYGRQLCNKESLSFYRLDGGHEALQKKKISTSRESQTLLI